MRKIDAKKMDNGYVDIIVENNSNSLINVFDKTYHISFSLEEIYELRNELDNLINEI
jgi:hypothetical protein